MKKIFVITLLAVSIFLSSCSGQSGKTNEDYKDQFGNIQSDINTDGKDTDIETTVSEDTSKPSDNETLTNTITPVGPKVELTEEETAVKGITLEKIGSITPQDEILFSKGDLSGGWYSIGDFICTSKEDGVFTMCDSEGNELENCMLVGASSPDYDGYVIILQKGELIPKSQLMTVSGDIIIPFSEINIEFLNERFLEIIVPEAITENAAEAVLRTSSSLFSSVVQEGDVFFKGYKKVFDLKTGEYVNNIEFRSNDSDIFACGDTLYVKDDHEYNMILDSDGNIITEGFKFCEVIGEMYKISFDYDNYALYDSNMNKVFEHPRTFTIYEIDNAKFLFEIMSDTEDNDFIKGVIDAYGNVLIEPKFDSIYEYNNGLFIVSIENENGIKLNGLSDINGNLIAPCEYQTLIYENGFYKGKKQDETGYVLLNSDGNIISTSSALDCFSYKESKGLYYVLALNTGEYQMEFERKPLEHLYAFGLLTAYDKINNGYALFEYVNGTQLTEYDYEAFKYHDGCIYALSGDTYTIYRINYQY